MLRLPTLEMLFPFSFNRFFLFLTLHGSFPQRWFTASSLGNLSLPEQHLSLSNSLIHSRNSMFWFTDIYEKLFVLSTNKGGISHTSLNSMCQQYFFFSSILRCIEASTLSSIRRGSHSLMFNDTFFPSFHEFDNIVTSCRSSSSEKEKGSITDSLWLLVELKAFCFKWKDCFFALCWRSQFINLLLRSTWRFRSIRSTNPGNIYVFL